MATGRSAPTTCPEVGVRLVLVAAILVLGAGCAHRSGDVAAPVPAEAAVLNPDATLGVSDPALRQLLSDQWEDLLRRSPQLASRLGDHRYDHLLGDGSPAGVASARQARGRFLARAEALDGAAMSAPDGLTLRIFQGDLRLDAATDTCRAEQWMLSARMNALVDLDW